MTMETRTNQFPPAQILDTLAELNNTQARQVAGQVAMTDQRAAQLLTLFQMSDERGKITLLAIAGIHAARYPQGKEKA